MKKIILSSLAICALFSLTAQKYQDFKFEKTPSFKLTAEEKEEKELVLKKVISYEYVIGDDVEAQYVYDYSARYVNSDEAIEKHNKVYLASSENTEIKFQKARVIKPSGEIIELKESDIKEGVYEENEQKYYYFALEGLEKGSIIETANYSKKSLNLYGSLVYLQERVKRLDQTFELICPEYLLFAFKSINDAPEMQKDTTIEDQNRWFVTVENAEGVKSQPTMYEDVVKMGILSKLDRNVARNVGDLTSYGTASRNIYENLHPEFSKSELKKIGKLAKEIKLSSYDSNAEKIYAIENYLKSNWQIIDNYAPELKNLEFMLENKAASETGISILHIALLKSADVPYEIVLTTDRTSLRFDPDFEAYLFLNNYALYFPSEDFYIAPTEKFLRAPLIPSEWTNNHGLFIKEVGVGDVKLPIGKIKYIDALAYDVSKDEMKIDVDFEESISKPMISIEKSSTGYSSQYFQPYFVLMDEEAITNVKKSLVEIISEEMEAEEVEIENTEADDIGKKPFVYRFSTDDHSFVEKAGGDFLFKIGLLIGPQMEMYQEEERQYDVESGNTRFYGREITFEIPEGYEIKNLADLNMEHIYKKDGKPNLYFKSYFKKEGNKVTVYCDEYYTQIIYAKDNYDKYQEVINAAADFNKIVLVLQKAG